MPSKGEHCRALLHQRLDATRHVAQFQALLPEYLERIEWERDRLTELRLRRLRHLVSTAVRSSPWHRDRLSGINAGEMTEGELTQLPVMTKTDLMSHFDDIVTDHRLSRSLCERHLEEPTPDGYLLDEYHVVASGGSSGQRGVFVYDREAWAICWASIVRFQIRDWASDPALAGIPRVTAVVAASKPSHISAAIGRTFSTPSSPRISFPVTEPMERIVQWLNELQPTILMGYSSFLPRLAGEARSGRLRIAPKRIAAISEPLFPEARRAVEEVWQVPIANGYGMSEGIFSGFCGRGIHLPDDLCYLEAVDREGRPTPVGTASHRILVTNLYNTVLPLIRFEITDEVTVVERDCPCGSRFRVIGDPQGRLDDTFVYPGGNIVHPHLFRSVLGREQGIVEYQVLQTSRGANLRVVVDAAVDLPSVAGDVRRGLGLLGIGHPEVSIEAVDQLDRQATGKLRRFIPSPTETMGSKRR
jgi:phenylacetate-coenzyme A ligase PaaK-like adenylate-forming protein